MSSVRRFAILAVLVSFVAIPALASHGWGNYHWPRTTTQVVLALGDNVDSRWDSHLNVAIADWNSSSVLDLSKIVGSTSTKRCNPDTGEIEVCNARYGRTGWLGVAGIWASGDHITKAYTKLNDTYFDTATYNTPEWRAMVTCQEIGHDFGLDHQDENFNNANLGTCMDYTNDPASNQHPNAHDYNQLEVQYGHIDAAALPFDGLSAAMRRAPTMDEILADAGQWGTPVRFDGKGRPSLFILEVGSNHEGHPTRVITHVLWAPIDVEWEHSGEIDRMEP
jgi:hypothetical protein